MSILDRLVREAAAQTEERRARVPEAELRRIVAALPPTRDLAAALMRAGFAVIAEMKARSPSGGVLCAEYSPARLAATYAAGGAAAISVLAQEASFGGRPEHLAEARAAVDLPILRKDFVTDEYQVLEARAFGADAVLLIAAVLSPARLFDLLEFARALDLQALVEVHDGEEVEAARAAGARVIGVNHRDLRTLAVDIGLTAQLRRLIPDDTIMVAESGIAGREDAHRLREAGADAILVGEALLRSSDPAAKVRELATA